MTRPRRTWCGACATGAGLFAVGSGLAVLACGWTAWNGGTSAIMRASDARGDVRSWGLFYAGRDGTLLAAAEVAALAAAWALSRSRGTFARRAGRAGLVAWASLWAFDSARWRQATPDALSNAVLAVIALAWIATLAHLACAERAVSGDAP